MQPLKKDLGSYMPAFFHMDLSFPFPCMDYPLERLSPKNLSTFIHEYIHFLQDISTHVGLNNAYVYSECIHAVVTNIYSRPKGDLKIPVTLPKYANIELNKIVNETSIGTIKEYKEFFLTKIQYEKITVNNSYIKNLTEVVLISAKKDKAIFGARAIMESMAYLMERNIAKGCSGTSDYPYQAAQMVVDKYYPAFGKDDMRIIALCDACLQFSEPGKIFVKTLKEFKKVEFLPDNANDIIDYFYNNTCVQMGENISIDMGLLKIGFTVGERLKTYMNDLRFNPFHNVVHNLIGFGMRERLKNRYFMLDIVRNGLVPNNALIQRYIREVGTPIIKDSNEDYWIMPPIGLMSDNYWIEYFPAIEQLYNCLIKGDDICGMVTWCNKSPETQEDDRCINAPWLRVSDTRLCPYAMLWTHWNLGKYSPKKN